MKQDFNLDFHFVQITCIRHLKKNLGTKKYENIIQKKFFGGRIQLKSFAAVRETSKLIEEPERLKNHH